MTIQVECKTEEEAQAKARELIAQGHKVTIILSSKEILSSPGPVHERRMYWYVEDGDPFVRVWESVIPIKK